MNEIIYFVAFKKRRKKKKHRHVLNRRTIIVYAKQEWQQVIGL